MAKKPNVRVPASNAHAEEAERSQKQAVNQSKWERAGSVGGRTKAPAVDTSSKAVKARRESRKRQAARQVAKASPIAKGGPSKASTARVRKITVLPDQTAPSARQKKTKQQGPSVKSAEYVGVGESQMKGGKPGAGLSGRPADDAAMARRAHARTQAAAVLSSSGVFPSERAHSVVNHIVLNHPDQQTAHAALGHLPAMVAHHGSEFGAQVLKLRAARGDTTQTTHAKANVTGELFRTGHEPGQVVPPEHAKVLHSILTVTGKQARRIHMEAMGTAGVRQGSNA